MRFKNPKSKFSWVLKTLLLFPYVIKIVSSDHDGSSDPLDWLRDSIPGEPGVDYPILAQVIETEFSCRDRVFGGKKSFSYSEHCEEVYSLMSLKIKKGFRSWHLHLGGLS